MSEPASYVIRWRYAIHRSPTLSWKAKTVALNLSCMMNAKGYCWCSFKTLAARSGHGSNAMWQGRVELEAKGWAKVGKKKIHQPNGVTREVNTYWARFPRGYTPEKIEPYDPLASDPFYGGTDAFAPPRPYPHGSSN